MWKKSWKQKFEQQFWSEDLILNREKKGVCISCEQKVWTRDVNKSCEKRYEHLLRKKQGTKLDNNSYDKSYEQELSTSDVYKIC